MKILAIGPYLGNFKEEIFTFRPYARWLAEAIEWDKIYLSTHLNRIFLYENFVPVENIIPVYQQYSRDEKNQNGYVHENIHKSDFRLILKKFKEEIIKRENCSKRDIEIHHLSYSKSTPPYSIYNKLFDDIPEVKVKIPKRHKNKIIFIPAKTEKIELLAYVYKLLKKRYNAIVVGSTDTWFSNENVVLERVDYFENGWKYLVQYITQAKAVVCPASYWTGLANLQRKPVFSWGENPGQYRYGGTYNFGNKKCSIIPESEDPNIIVKGMEDFLKNEV